MSATGLLVGIGSVLAAVGVVGLIGGLAVAVAGPEAADDAGGGRSEGAELGVLSIGGGSDDRADDRNDIRAAGGSIMLAGAVAFLAGGLLYAVGRGVDRRRSGAQQQSQQVTVVVK